MTEPSEEWLDWQFKKQMASYMKKDLTSACVSDRVIMARWLKVFQDAPPSQKLARNSLLLLMHAHVSEFGFLRFPFTDVFNCKRDLNHVIGGYHGLSIHKTPPKSATSKSTEERKELSDLAVARCANRPLRRISKLDPIEEVTEPSSAFSSKMTGIRGKKIRSDSSDDSSIFPSHENVRQKIRAIEGLSKTQDIQKKTRESYCNDAESSSFNRFVIRQSPDRHSQIRKPESGSSSVAKKTPPPMETCSTQNVRSGTPISYSSGAELSSSSGYVAGVSQEPPSQRWKPPAEYSSSLESQQSGPREISTSDKDVAGLSQDPPSQGWKPPTEHFCDLRGMQSCFQEISERLKTFAAIDNPVLRKIKETTPSPVLPERSAECSSTEVLFSKNRIKGGQSIPLSYRRDRTLMDLMRSQEELRLQCLEYYNLDGTLKYASELPAPKSVPATKIEGFSVGVHQAMERLKHWRGEPNNLKFFNTIFRGCGLGTDNTGRVKALDRRFEKVALQWLHSKRRHHIDGITVEQKPPQGTEELLEMQKAVKKEYKAHLTEIRKLCEIHCRGVIRPDVLDRMFHCLDKHCELVNGDVDRLTRQLEAMLSTTC